MLVVVESLFAQSVFVMSFLGDWLRSVVVFRSVFVVVSGGVWLVRL